MPLIQQALLGTSSGRVEGILVRGMLVSDIKRNEILNGKVLQGSLDTLTPGSGYVALGSELARNLGAQVGSTITHINPAHRKRAVKGKSLTVRVDIGCRRVIT